MNMIKIMIPDEMPYEQKEAYKSLRSNILFCGSDVKTIAFTSTLPSEGKSSVTMNLAMSLAESGKRVAYVDADMRKSVFASRYRIGRGAKGLSHYLSGQVEYMDAVYMTSVPNLHVVMAGPVPPNPAELLGNQRFTTMLMNLRESHDYVIVDTPPLGSVSDGAIVAHQCDGAVMVVSAKMASRKYVKKIMKTLENSNERILGVVLNKADMKSNPYYGRYYGKAYGEEKSE